MAQISVAKLEEIPCNLCGADRPKVVCIDNSYQICRCQGCSLIYVNPQPVINFDESELYPPGEDWAEHIKAATKNTFAHGLKSLYKYRPDKGALLDVGCGYGFFLEQAGAHGWEPFGADISIQTVKYANEVLGISTVRRGTLEEIAYPDGKFSAVTLWNCLEHVPDPLGTLREVHRICAPGGVVFVRVPNMLFHRVSWKAKPIRGMLGLAPTPYLAGAVPAHLYGFTPLRLRLVVDKAGFDVIGVVPAVLRASTKRLGQGVATLSKMVYLVSGTKLVVNATMIAYGRKASV